MLLQQLQQQPPTIAAVSKEASPPAAATPAAHCLPSREGSVASYVATIARASSRPSTAGGANSSSSRPSTAASWGSWDRSGGATECGGSSTTTVVGMHDTASAAAAATVLGGEPIQPLQSPDTFSVVSSLGRPISVWNIDALRDQLRTALGGEAAALAAAIAQLRAALEEQVDQHSATRAKPPGLGDLQATSSSLQAAVADQAAAVKQLDGAATMAASTTVFDGHQHSHAQPRQLDAKCLDSSRSAAASASTRASKQKPSADSILGHGTFYNSSSSGGSSRLPDIKPAHYKTAVRESSKVNMQQQPLPPLAAQSRPPAPRRRKVAPHTHTESSPC